MTGLFNPGSQESQCLVDDKAILKSCLPFLVHSQNLVGEHRGKAKKNCTQPTLIRYDQRRSQRVNRRSCNGRMARAHGGSAGVGPTDDERSERVSRHRHTAPGLTFGLWASSLSCMSCAKVCSRILLSSACCRLSFMSSSVSSSG